MGIIVIVVDIVLWFMIMIMIMIAYCVILYSSFFSVMSEQQSRNL